QRAWATAQQGPIDDSKPGAAQARQLWTDGLRQREKEDYESAARSFEAAYAIQPAATFLVFAAGSYRLHSRQLTGAARKPSLEAAARRYRDYLAKTTDPDGRDEIEKELLEIEAELR